MNEILSRFEAGEIIGLVAVTGVLLCGLVAIIMGIWHVHRKAEINAALKQDMLNRGMSADDIRMVLDAGTPQSGKGCSTGQSSSLAG
jgi:hypothetical protein